jgi:hypothetical protein
MFISKKHISRRTVLRGIGASLALPFLESMVPAMTPLVKTAASPKTRLVAIEMVHGAAGSTTIGRAKNYWSPVQVGRGFEFTPTLKSLESVREYITVISNTQLRNAMSLAPEENGPMADHARSSAVFLTGAHPNRSQRNGIQAGPSIDQIYAQAINVETPISSIQLCIEDNSTSSECGNGYSCTYSHTISWASPTTPLPMVRAPRVVFDRLFGVRKGLKSKCLTDETEGSMLDSLSEAIARLKSHLDTADRDRVNQFIERVRLVEERIQRIEKRNSSSEPRALANAPLSVPDSFDEHVELMFDLQLLAFMADITRVSSFKMGIDRSERVYPQSGVTTPFHTLSHHREEPDRVEEYARLNAYHVTKVSYFLELLRNSLDGDGNLLDHAVVVYGSPMGDSHVHDHRFLPLVVAGRANGGLKGNLHVNCQDDTPMANVLLTLMHRLGVEIVNIGDSTGEVPI